MSEIKDNKNIINNEINDINEIKIKDEDNKNDKNMIDIKNEIINKKNLKKIEKENEEINKRISSLKEKLIESKKGSYCTNLIISEREVFTVIDKVYPIIEKEESLLELDAPIYMWRYTWAIL